MTTPTVTTPSPILSASDYVNQVRQILAVSDPQLDTGIGSIVRKIADAFGQVQASANADSAMVDYIFNINAKSGSDLDDFVLMFSMLRFQPLRATGIVTMSRPAVSAQDIPVGPSTQVATSGSPAIVFATANSATLPAGSLSMDMPVQAVVAGSTGNVAAGTVTLFASDIQGLSVVTNSAPMTGGTDYETDAQLRQRFLRTVFRNLAGTSSMFLGTAIEDTGNPTVTTTDTSLTAATAVVQAIVFGSSQRWREQVQVVSGVATSTIPTANAKYIFAGTQFFGPSIDGGDILTPGIHYTFDATVNPPTVTSIGSALTDGDLYDLDFEYSSASSRNDPADGITNRVDVWVTGVSAQTAAVTLYFNSASPFTGAPDTSVTTTNYVRLETGAHPVAGNFFLALGFGPILTFPSSLTFGGNTYNEGTDYWVVHDDTAFGYGPSSLFGLEWLAASAPADGTQIVLSGDSGYTYNSVPGDVEGRLAQWGLVTTDVRAHAAKQVLLRLNLVVQFDPLAVQAQVTDNISATVSAFMAATSFDSVLQVSDLLQAIHSVVGVDNVRMRTSYEQGVDITPSEGYGIQQMSATGALLKTLAVPDPAVSGRSSRSEDISLGDNQVASLYDITVDMRAQNTFGTT